MIETRMRRDRIGKLARSPFETRICERFGNRAFDLQHRGFRAGDRTDAELRDSVRHHRLVAAHRETEHRIFRAMWVNPACFSGTSIKTFWDFGSGAFTIRFISRPEGGSWRQLVRVQTDPKRA